MPPSLALLIPTHLEAQGAPHHLADAFLLSGPGKVNAAVAAARATLEIKADILLVWGLAGGLGPGVKRGDFVIADTLYQHDFNIAPLLDCAGPGEIPGCPAPHWPCAATLGDLAEAAIETALPGARVWRGPVATGDRFISGDEVPVPAQMPAAAHPLAVDMESAALWQALHRLRQDGFKTPELLVVRVISDSACEQAAGDFTGFLRQFEGRTRILLPALLHALRTMPHA